MVGKIRKEGIRGEKREGEEMKVRRHIQMYEIDTILYKDIF